jgi:hypothetical protein
MKVAANLLAVIMALAPAFARAAGVGETRRGRTQRPGAQLSPLPEQLTFTVRLQKHPELATADSSWEVSYRVYVSDRDSYVHSVNDRAARPAEGESNQAAPPKPGKGQKRSPVAGEPEILLKQGSFSRADLSRDANREFMVAIPVGATLSRRFVISEREPQVIWMRVTVKVRSGKMHLDLTKDDIRPLWDLRYFVKDKGHLVIGISPKPELRWSTKDPPPWDAESPDVLKMRPL